MTDTPTPRHCIKCGGPTGYIGGAPYECMAEDCDGNARHPERIAQLETDLQHLARVAGKTLRKIDSELTDTQWQPIFRIAEARSVIKATLSEIQRIKELLKS